MKEWNHSVVNEIKHFFKKKCLALTYKVRFTDQDNNEVLRIIKKVKQNFNKWTVIRERWILASYSDILKGRV